jgi:alkylated DNA repair dioxygenase AlkB
LCFLKPDSGQYKKLYQFFSGAEMQTIERDNLRLRRWDGVGEDLDTASLLKEMVFLPKETTKVWCYGKYHDAPRLIGAHSDMVNGATIAYTYSRSTIQASEYTPTMRAIKEMVEERVGHKFNFVLVNCYRSNEDSIGYHRDNEKGLDEEAPIASLSIGASRDFYLRNIKTREIVKLKLNHGTLVTMEGNTNKDWEHSIPRRASKATKRKKGEQQAEDTMFVKDEVRLNFTFRVIKT